MADFKLDSQEQAVLVGVVEKIKGSKNYANYTDGVRRSSKRAEASLKGEGDAFAKIGEALRSDNVPSFLSDTAKGQQKVQKALEAELKQQKLQGVLKDNELGDIIYQDLFVNPGTLNKFLGNSSQEENMIDENENKQEEDENEDHRDEGHKRDRRKDNDGPVLGYGEGYDDKGNLIKPDDEKVDRPDYGSDFWSSPEVVALNLPQKLNKAQLAKAEEMYADYYSRSMEREEGYDDENPDNNNENPDTLEVNGVDGDERTNDPVDEDWVTRYDAALKRYGEANSNIWTRDNEEDEKGNRPLGLKGAFANGTEVHYTAADKMSVNTPKGKEISADHFKEIVSLAKENEQQIKLGTVKNPEFRKALIEACAIGGVEMQDLNDEEMALYNGFRPKEEKEPIKAAEAKDTDEKGDPLYKLNPVITRGRLVEYSGNVYSANHYSQRAVNAGNDEFDREIAAMERNLKEGNYKVTGEHKAKAELLLKKYVRAEAKNDKETQDLCQLALQRYGLDNISRKPKGEGVYSVTTKPYAERTDDEKAKIAEATEKMLPKKDKENNPDVLRAMQEKQGQRLN